MLDIFKTKIFNQMCEKLIPPVEGGTQWLPLVRKLVLHMLNTLSQCHLYSDAEYSAISDSAWDEAKLLLLPVVRDVPIDILTLEAWTREIFFEKFKLENVHRIAARIYRTMYRDDVSFYNSLVYLLWQSRIGARYLKEYAKHLASDPMNREMYGFVALDRLDSLEELGQYFFEHTSDRILSDSEREEPIYDALYEWREKLLRDVPPLYNLQAALEYTPTVVRNKLIDAGRTKHRQKRYPEGGVESLDAEVTTPDGRKISKLEILEGKHESLQTQPMEIRYPLTVSQKKALREFLSNTEVKILEIYYNYSDATQAEVAEYVGCTQSKVSKAQRKFKRFGEKIKKILEIQ